MWLLFLHTTYRRTVGSLEYRSTSGLMITTNVLRAVIKVQRRMQLARMPRYFNGRRGASSPGGGKKTIRILVCGRHRRWCSGLRRWSSGLSHTSKPISRPIWPRTGRGRLMAQVAGDIPRELFRRMCDGGPPNCISQHRRHSGRARRKYGVSFVKKFRVVANETDNFTERDPEEEQGWTPKKGRKKHPWDHKHNMETHLPAGKYTSLRSKFTGPSTAAFENGGLL